MAIATEDFISQIDQLTVLELNSLVKALEDHYGVSAAAAVAAAPAAGGGAAAPVVEEKTEFDVGLKSAKDLVESAPATVKEAVSKDEAESIKKKFEEAGATIEIK